MTRYFKSTMADNTEWKFEHGEMLIRQDNGQWEESICSIEDLQECLDTIETNEDGEALS